MRIAVDCDLTVVDTATPWLEWLNSACGTEWEMEDLAVEGVIDYDLTSYFHDDLPQYLDGFEYWRNKYLYHTMLPYGNAADVLANLHHSGHEVFFVSAITGAHCSSKYKWLMKHFPFNSGVVFTKEKHLVGADIIIDDRNEFLNGFSDKTIKYKIVTPYTQRVPLDCKVIHATDWNELDVLMEGLY